MLQVRDYMNALEGHLAEVHKQAQRLLKRQAELGLALQDFGASLACLSAFDSAPLDQAFQGLADRASAASNLTQVCTLVQSWGSSGWRLCKRVPAVEPRMSCPAGCARTGSISRLC